MYFSLDYLIGFPFLTCWVYACWNSAECSFFRCSWNFGQSFGYNWIGFSQELNIYCLDWLDPPSVHLRHKCFLLSRTQLFFFFLLPGRLYYSCTSLLFSFLFFIDVARSWVNRMVLSAIWTSNFLQAIFLHMVRVLFISLGTYLSSSYSESYSDKFLFFYSKNNKWCLFFAGPMLHHPPQSPICVENVPTGKPIRLCWDRDTRPVYSSWE